MLLALLMVLLPVTGCIGEEPWQSIDEQPRTDSEEDVGEVMIPPDGDGSEPLVCIEEWVEVDGTCLLPITDLDYRIPARLTVREFHWFEPIWNGTSPSIGMEGTSPDGTNATEEAVSDLSSSLICEHPQDANSLQLQRNASVRIYATGLGYIGPCTIAIDNGAGVASQTFGFEAIDLAPRDLDPQLKVHILTLGQGVLIPSPEHVGGEVVSWTISPPLPLGLSLEDDGSIAGMPLKITPTKTHTIWANNSGGSASVNISFTVIDQPPVDLRWFNQDLVLTVNQSFDSLPAIISGGTPVSFEIDPALPFGLSIDPDTGAISGIPTALLVRMPYHVWANNSGGSSVAIIHLTIIDFPIASILYPRMPLDMVWGNDSVDMLPETGGGEPVHWSIVPELPAGLSFDEQDGRIVGAAMTKHPWTNHTIKAYNSAGNISTELQVRIADITPYGLDWSSNEFVLAANATISLTVQATTAVVDSYEVTPPLPDGLTLDSKTGTIHGSPLGRTVSSAISAGGIGSRHAWTTHTVWANNSGGSLSTNLTFAIHDLDVDHAELTARPVGSLDYGGSWPSLILPFGTWAFPIGFDHSNRPIASGSHVGKGRMVGYGHETMVGRTGGDSRSNLSINSLDWVCDRNGANSASPRVGLASDWTGWRSILEEDGYVVTLDATPSDLQNLDCFVTEFWNSYSESENRQIEAWLLSGGGLVMGGHAWYWSYSNSDAPHQYPGNRIAKTTGLLVSTSSGSSRFDVPSQPWGPLHRTHGAIPHVAEHLSGGVSLEGSDASNASTSIRLCAGSLPLDFDGFWGPVRAMTNSTGWIRIDSNNQHTLGADPIEDLLLTVQESLMRNLPADELVAHPSSTDFPGPVDPNAPRLNRTLAIDGDFQGLPGHFSYANAGAHGRMSTGLYAAPGDVVTVTVPPSIVGTGAFVLIGGHTDSLWGKTTLHRHPRIDRWWPVDNETIEVGNSFGGAIYIAIDAGSTLGAFDVTIRGAVEMAWYRHGITNLTDWIQTLRYSPAPTAELESDQFILTVPSADIRNLDDPDHAMDFWDEALEMEHELSGYVPWPRVERAQFDVQISAGWMHSGYPFMAHLASVEGVVNGTRMYEQGDWGMFHELGHNHQWGPATLPGNTETTCNLYSVRLMTDLVGLNLSEGHSALNTNSRQSRTETYFANGANISDWSVWTALETHLQIQEEFGWAPFTAAFREYYYNYSSQPSDSSAEFNQFSKQISLNTGHDLTPFLSAWGLPLTQETVDSVSHLPVWTTDPLRGWVHSYDPVLKQANATNISASSADLQWSVRDNGSNVTVTVCWGESDGGVNESAWDQCEAVGGANVGLSRHLVTGLSSGTIHWYRVYAENENGRLWLPASSTFTTL